MWLDGTTTSPDLTGVATSILVVATLVGAVVALAMGRDAARSAKAARQMQAFLQIYPHYRSERGDKARGLLSEGKFHGLTQEEKQSVRELYGWYELMAIMVDSDLIDEAIVRKVFGNALSLAVEMKAAWLKVHTPGNGPLLYIIHLETMVKRWPQTDTDQRPTGLLNLSYPAPSSARMLLTVAEFMPWLAKRAEDLRGFQPSRDLRRLPWWILPILTVVAWFALHWIPGELVLIVLIVVAGLTQRRIGLVALEAAVVLFLYVWVFQHQDAINFMTQHFDFGKLIQQRLTSPPSPSPT